ncbi:MAG: thioester domain-containing protein [Thomasclavelia ramosa]
MKMNLLKYYTMDSADQVMYSETIGVTNDTTKYLYTHIMASYAYSGDIYGGKSWEDAEAHGVSLKTKI